MTADPDTPEARLGAACEGFDGGLAMASVSDIRAVLDRLARAEEALRPFAQEHAWGPETRFEIIVAGHTGSITGADLDRARAALRGKDAQ